MINVLEYRFIEHKLLPVNNTDQLDDGGSMPFKELRKEML